MYNLSELSDEKLSQLNLSARDIRLICFDIDGTLLGANGVPSEAVKTEISRIQQLGIKTCIASGRPWFSSRWLAEELKLNSPGMFNTGAVIIDPKTEEILYSQPLLPKEVVELIQAAKSLNLYMEIYTADDYVVEKEHPLQEVHQYYMKRPALRANFADVISEKPIYKVLLCADEASDGQLIHQLAKQFPALHFGYGHGAAHPHLLFASIVSERACKKNAFNWLLNYHNIAAENVMSFGDGGSDIPFLQQAGIGVAMGNAKNEVKELANIVTLDVESNGVAYALQRLIP